MPLRNSLSDYRYAYQGQEKDPETGKEAFELRLWDSRIGRWLTTDPAGQFNSPYMAMGNNPIISIDPDGGTATTIFKLKGGKSTDIVNIDDGINKTVEVNQADFDIAKGFKSSLGAFEGVEAFSPNQFRDYLSFQNRTAYGDSFGDRLASLPEQIFDDIIGNKLRDPNLVLLETPISTGPSKALGTSRTIIKNYLKNVGNIPRAQLVRDLESAGFKSVFKGKGMEHFARGNFKIRLDPPDAKTFFNHMHINVGGNKKAFDILLRSVKAKSPAAHIPIR